ncbi:MAG: site-specific integrase [Firmicutes bacterium]|nr:site-specific integrase [Bacillota bacterium]
MSVSKDKKTGKWIAQVRIRDQAGKVTHKKKRGFATKKAAQEWVNSIGRKDCSLDMPFAKFVELYLDDAGHRMKPSTMATKRMILTTKILPYFGEMQLDAIGPADVRSWQNAMMSRTNERGLPFAKTYLRTMHGQLTAVFNYAMRYYRLRENPCRAAGSIGTKKGENVNFWTKEEFLRFLDTQRGNAATYTMFMVLYYTGMREGELLALTVEDVDFERMEIWINKTYQRIARQDIVMTPKTPKSNRVISMSPALGECLKGYLEDSGIWTGRVFPYSRYYLYRQLKKGCASAGVKTIRVHDLRHSHASLLVEMGYSPLLIAERLGHDHVQTTMDTYSHLYPNKQRDVANRLDAFING